MNGFIYLASPFWHESEQVRLQRYARVRNKTAEALCAGHAIFSPIVHSFHVHHLLHEGLRHSHDFWLAHDFSFIRKADALWVLQLDGWQESKGIEREIHLALELSLPIFLLGETDAIPPHPEHPRVAYAPTQRIRAAEVAGAGGLDRPSGLAERSSGAGG